MRFLCVGIKVIQTCHPDTAYRAHEWLLARVNPLVDLVFAFVIKLLVTLMTGM